MLSDRLNPIVVKELRQGLKSRGFMATFVGLQAAMVMSMVFYFGTLGAGGGDLQFAEGFFWFMLGLMLLVFMPLRAFQAIHEEIKGNTLEMLFLTRMSAWNIASGKWAALAIQCVLLLTAVLPYLVIRYFIGSIDLARDLFLLAAEFLLSLLLVGVAVGLSSWKTRLLRGLLTIGALSSLYLVPMGLFGLAYGRGVSSLLPGWRDLLLLLLGGGLVTLFFIEYGASQIAPPAENHAFRKRLLAYGIFAVFSVFSLFVREAFAPAMPICIVLLIPVFVDALCEPVLLIPALYRARCARNPLRLLLLPGWPSGVFFTLSVLLAYAAVHRLSGGDAEDTIKWFLALYNFIFLPLALMVFIPGAHTRGLAAYFLIQVGVFLLTLFGGLLASVTLESGGEAFLSLFTVASLFAMLIGEGRELDPAVMLIPAVLISIPVFLRLPEPLARIRRLLYSS